MDFSSAIRDKHKGEVCYIVGKGPSIQKWERPVDGVVIALNEACLFVPADYSMQQDGKPECMIRPKEGETLLLSERSAHWFEDYEPRLVYSQTKDLGIQDKIISAVSAIEVARLFGCKEVVFVGFDSLTVGDASYPGNLWQDPDNSLARFKRFGEILKLSIKGMPARLLHPDGTEEIWDSAPYTIITLTGDRHLPFSLCRKYVLRQTLLPSQWLVVDDGKAPMHWPQYAGAHYVRREPTSKDPDHTIKVNMLEALKHVKYDHVVIMEDDDWYPDDFCLAQVCALQHASLVGETGAVYYHWPTSQVVRVESETHAALFKTGFTKDVFELVEDICRTTKGPLIDVPLWKRFDGKKLLFEQGRPPIAVGMKGLPGREGTTSGWRSNRAGYSRDPGNDYLIKIIGKDVDDYRQLFNQRERKVNKNLSYEQSEDERYSWLYEHGPYNKPGISMFRISKFVDWACRTTDLENQTIVDLGCGRGELSKMLPFKHYTGVDLSTYQINKNVEENDRDNVNFVHHSITSLPFDDMQFDVAICMDVMEHVPLNKVDQVLGEMFRVAHSVMLVIDCVPAKLTDKDGSNLHCTIQPPKWWLRKITPLSVIRYQDWQDNKLTLFCGSGFKSQGVFPDTVQGVRLRRHPDGSVWINRGNAQVEKEMDSKYLRVGRELRWHYPIAEPHKIEHLRGKFAGKVCNIIGKGPSLDYIQPSDLADGPVIAINESIHQMENMIPCPKDLFLMQQDTGINCRPKAATMLLYFYIKHLYPEVKNRYVFTDTDFGRGRHGLTVLVAIACARYMGCTGVRLICFDACVNKKLDYAKCIGHEPVRTSSGDKRRFLTHRRLIDEASQGLDVEWRIPEVSES